MTSTGSLASSARRLLLPRSMRGPSRRAAWQRARLRRWLSALLLGVAAWVAVGALLPTPVPTGVPVVVAAGDLPAGHRLLATDLQVSHWPAQLRPDRTYAAVDLLVGRALAGPMSRGEAVSAGRIRGAGLLRALPDGQVLAHIEARDPGLAALLRPGDRVDALSTADGTVLGANLLVLAGAAGDQSAGDGAWTPGAAGAASAALAPGDSPSTSGVLVAATPAVAARLAVSSGSDAPGAGIMLTVRPAT